jgi:hypothetical protein
MYQDAPLWALMPKVKDFYGKNYPLPMRVANPQGRSATFSNAQAQKTPSNYKDFTLTRSKDYSLASIDSETWLAAESDAGAFLKTATGEIDGALMSLIQARSGATGRIFATGVSTATVVKVDRDAGTITTDVDNSANTDTIVANDTLNVVGDYNAKMSGLLAWIPASAPAATAFFGLDRTIDATRLAGVRVSSSGKPLDEAYIDAARRVGREGASPDYAFCGFSRYASLEKTLGSRVIYSDVEVAGVGFRGIKISGPNRPITVLPDRDCPEAYSWLLTMDSWAYYSLKEPVMILDLDGNKMLREGSADAYEIRCATFGQLGCEHPGANAIMVF